MNVSKRGFQDYQPGISRYASRDEKIPGLSGNRLEFKIDPWVNLPIMSERFITAKGYIIDNRNQIAVVRVDLDKTINTYYINIADTSVLYITSMFRSDKKEQIQGSEPLWQSDKVITAEISFSHPVNADGYVTEWVTTREEFRLRSKNNPAQNISRTVVFAAITDS